MEDVGKALIMGAQILMFVFAGSISIYLYTTLTNNVDEFMLAGNYSNRGDAIIGEFGDNDTTRNSSKAEVIMAILDLKNKYEKTGEIYEVKVRHMTFKYVPDDDEINISTGGVSYNYSLDDATFISIINSIPDRNRLLYEKNGKVLNYTTN